ncbi:helix-turn-helix domain-containing protein [Glutamicibacter ardleyensis]|uniref:MerR family transcriptional regulator n=1 Tax=Glutamicibacter ardleyensis TaxID=225894 RepID=A0ABQ2DUT7_9MICC|nr:MerR family transcriptional regulator [Glutamicibacter ardleyensis]GGJ72024.1 MerR family transcriptional regulator [Glutamicibacter ardleyensis]
MACTAEHTMHIGELADRTGLSLRTIRHYGEIGLLPASTRTEGGFRVYSESDCTKVLGIKCLKFLGFDLETIAEMLDVTQNPDAARLPRIQTLVAEARISLNTLEQQLAEAHSFIAALERKSASNE